MPRVKRLCLEDDKVKTDTQIRPEDKGEFSPSGVFSPPLAMVEKAMAEVNKNRRRFP